MGEFKNFTDGRPAFMPRMTQTRSVSEETQTGSDSEEPETPPPASAVAEPVGPAAPPPPVAETAEPAGTATPVPARGLVEPPGMAFSGAAFPEYAFAPF
jgi:hypothetical protein